MAKKVETEPKKGLEYKGKPLLRKDNKLYYGNPTDRFIISMTVQDSTEIMDIPVSTSVLVELMTNENPSRDRVIKKAERDGIYAALDLGEFWLAEALGEN